MGERAIEGVGESGGKGCGQEIDVELQIAGGVEPVYRQGSTMAIGGAEEIKRDGPSGRIVESAGPPWFVPMEGMTVSTRSWGIEQFDGASFSGKQRDVQVEAIEVVATEGREKNPANLLVIASDFEFLRGAAEGQIVDENLGLVEGAVRDAGQFTEFEIAEVLNADPDSDTQHGEHETEGTSGRPQQEQAEHGETGRNCVKNNHDLAVSHSMLQELVMDVLTVGGEHGSSADEAADDREHCLENRQAERHDRDRDGNDGWRFLRTIESQGAQEKSYEQAARITQEYGRRIEVVAQKSQDGACKSDGHDFDQRGAVQERDCEDDHRGEQSGSGGQAVEAVDQVKGIGDCQNPDDRGSETNVPGEDTVAQQDGDIHDAETAGVQHGGGNSLHREFHIGADAAKVVIHAEQKDDGRGHEDGSQRLQEVQRMQDRMTQGPESGDAHAKAETQEDRDSAQTGQRARV